MTNDYQYVQDMDIFWYGQNNLNEIENRVAMSLMFKENTYWVVEQVEPDVISKPLVSLETSNFFRLKNS